MKTKNTILLIASLCFCAGICDAQVTLYTPRGSVVYGKNLSEFTPAEITLYTNQARNSYPKATVLSNASRTYNCHSYAWNLTTGGNTYCWVNQTEYGQGIANYWNDNSYTSSPEAVAEKIFYPDGDHSATRSSVGGKYDSKWGSYPIMRHDPGYGPYTNMRNRRYYVRNVKVGGSKLISSSGSTVTITNPGTFRTSTQWNYSSNLQLVSSTNSSATFRSTTNSAGWVSASFNGYTTTTQGVWAGKPVITDVTGDRRVSNGQYANFYAVYNYDSSPTSFQWILNPQGRNSVYGANSSSCTIAFYDPGSYQLIVRATNANGMGDYYVTGVGVYSNSNYTYQVYPNPANDVLIVNFEAKRDELIQPPLEIGNIEESIRQIEPGKIITASYMIYLFNENGSIVRKTNMNGQQQVEFDVSGLPNGIYYLHVDDGSNSKPEKHKIIVSH